MVSQNFYKEYQDYLKAVKADPKIRFNLPKPEKEETLEELVAAGIKILEGEEEATIRKTTRKTSSVRDEKKRLESQLASTSDNTYIRARIQLLNKMTPEARTTIEKMENGNIEKDRRYDEFVKQVRILGDQLDK